ncbi:MAG: DUF5618 family protein [Bacteroidales bacterium]|jgi:uncharacterized protein YnzC (UPF0291/DUF896 family)|nr:DUF5618 family protein [Bacteroidales bacterium]
MSTVDKSRKSVRQKSNVDVFSNKVSNILDDLTLSQKERQQALRKVYYDEAVRYRENAKKYLEKVKINNKGHYEDKKYVRTACGVAYSGLLIALDCYLILKGVEVMERTKKDIHFYRANLNKQNRKLGSDLDNAYEILHLWGYYDGITSSSTVKDGFKELDMFIELINPNKS